MSNRNISQPLPFSFDKLISNVLNYFSNTDTSKWVNGRPVLINGDVWCPMCETWHANNSLCQQ
jgi:hypothetical protein